MHFSNKRHKRLYAEAVAVSANGSRGDPKEVNRIIRDADR